MLRITPLFAYFYYCICGNYELGLRNNPDPMYTATFYKLGYQWYLDYPEYLERGDGEDLLQIGALHQLLDQSSAGKTTLTFQWDIRAFDGAEILQLQGTSGDRTGGYYQLSTLNGKNLDAEIWMNKVLYCCFPKLPQIIYFKYVSGINSN